MPSEPNEMTSDEAFMVVAAFRYALGRRTYASQIVPNEIRRVWPRLPKPDRALIVREITEAEERHYRTEDETYSPLGDDCDRNSWIGLRNEMKERIDE